MSPARGDGPRPKRDRRRALEESVTYLTGPPFHAGLDDGVAANEDGIAKSRVILAHLLQDADVPVLSDGPGTPAPASCRPARGIFRDGDVTSPAPHSRLPESSSAPPPDRFTGNDPFNKLIDRDPDDNLVAAVAGSLPENIAGN